MKNIFLQGQQETDLHLFQTINGQWVAIEPANNSLGSEYYQGINFGFSPDDYVVLINGLGSNDLYFGRWQKGWLGWNKFWHSNNLNRKDADFVAKIFSCEKIGIGTDAPIEKLHVNGKIFLDEQGTLDGWAASYFYWTGHHLIMGSPPGNYKHNMLQLRPGGSDKGALYSCFQMHTAPKQGVNELKVQIHSDGNTYFNGGKIGIGTDNPQYKLDVTGTARITSENKTDGHFTALKIGKPNDQGILKVLKGKSSGHYDVDFYTWRDAQPDQIGARIRAERVNIWENNNALVQAMHLAFYTSNGWSQEGLQERMRLTQDGVNINGKIFVQIPGSGDPIEAMNIDVASFWTKENASRSHYFRVRDIGAGNYTAFTIKGNGNVGIGTDTPQHKLDVKGAINAQTLLVNNKRLPYADHVFNDDYQLRPLAEVENFVTTHKHLPDIPSAKSMEKNGVDIGELQIKLLQKIEELTLYVIEQDKKINEQEKRIKNLEMKLINILS